jgi:GTP cyclohydrolase III
MATTVRVPSPTLVLRSPDIVPINTKTAKKTASTPLSASKNAAKASEINGVTKRKQSKSRNGKATLHPALIVRKTSIAFGLLNKVLD